jgi:F-type H+-transporting ATPase subunit epsilon
MINLSILNIEQTVFEGQVYSLTLPGEQGELTILPNHLPLITSIKSGSISTVIDSNEKKYFECRDGGILEFSDNKATILL